MAFSVARLTLALATPGTFASAFSTRRTQEAQVIPSIGKIASPVEASGVGAEAASRAGAGAGGGGATTWAVYPAFLIAPSICSDVTWAGSKVTDAFSVARLTLAADTPSSLVRAFSTRRTQEAQVMPSTSRSIC